jgi:hypothetical protein
MENTNWNPNHNSIVIDLSTLYQRCHEELMQLEPYEPPVYDLSAEAHSVRKAIQLRRKWVKELAKMVGEAPRRRDQHPIMPLPTLEISLN